MRYFLYQLLRGLKYMHSAQVIQAQDGAALAIRGNIAAVVESRQTSPRDLMRALDAALARLSYFGAAVEFSDAALSAIVNACGSWGESATPESVKTFRHSTR